MNPDPATGPPRPRGLYAITADRTDTGRLLDEVEGVLGAGASWLQYRNKAADPGLRERQAGALLPLCARHGVPLIINDDWRLAAAVGAAGAHLGEADGELAQARTALGPGAILGASCYNRIELAREAVAAGASYVAFGAFHPSSTKPAARRATPRLLRDAAALGVPRVAIGGITPDNAPALIQAGADLVAVISGLFDAPDPVAAARAYLRGFAAPPPNHLPPRAGAERDSR